MSQLLGALFAILVGIISLPTYLAYQNQSNENLRAATTAQQATQFNSAASTYVQENSVAIQATATATVPATYTVATLKAANLLPAAFSDTNPYGQTWELRVLEPSAGNLQALAMTTGGTALPDKLATKIATIVGANGGFIPLNDSTIYIGGSANANGAYAGWTVPTANFGAVTGGHLASLLTFNNGQLADNRLYRNLVPGQPQLNEMNTPLLMSASTIQIAGTLCTTPGAIARDAAGAVLACNGGSWKAGGLTWKGNVANIAALPASGNSSGDAYRITNLSNHVFVWDSQHSVWQGLVVNSAGNLTLPGLIYTSGSNSTYGAITMQGAKNGYSGINFKDASGNNAGTLMMSPGYSGFFNAADGAWRWYVDNVGNSIQAGNAQAGTLQVTTTVAEGSGCSPDGKIAKSSATSGLILSCQSGVWKKSSGTAGTISPIVGISWGTWYCLGTQAFVHARKRSAGATLQGVRIDSNTGNNLAISTGQSEGHLGYENASAVVSASECFMVQSVGGGDSLWAYYRTM